MKNKLLLSVICSAITLAPLVQAETLRWARSGDSLTLDPHAQNERTTHTLNHQIYEPLLLRDMSGKIVPALAESWAPVEGTNVWRFKLRQGVKFHQGESFDADDTVFSLNRAQMETSDVKGLLASIKEVRKVDKYTVDIETNGPNPLLPNSLTNLFMMDEGWTTKNNSAKPQDFESGETSYAAANANGTGAYLLVSRKPDERTVLKANPNYWGLGQFPLVIDEIVYTPIQSPATRVAALLSGEVDFVQDAPVQDLNRISSQDSLRVITAPENRTLFFGMNINKDDLDTDSVQGKNPFADIRVREAINLSINRDAIKKVVMRGQSVPTGVIMPPFVNGWNESLDKSPSVDIKKAKALMADAGYGDGFSITLNCPNDRYINDEAICQAAVGMLGQIGIKANLDSKPKAQHFTFIKERTTEFYLLGWGVPTFDSSYIFNYLVHTPTEKLGSWNVGYGSPELDNKIASLDVEVDEQKRNQTIDEIWQTIKSDIAFIPLHNQVLNWSMKDNIQMDVQPEDTPHVKYVTLK